MSIDEAYILEVPARTPVGWIEGTIGLLEYTVLSDVPLKEISLLQLSKRFGELGPQDDFEYYYIQGSPANLVALKNVLEDTRYRWIGPVIPEDR